MSHSEHNFDEASLDAILRVVLALRKRLDRIDEKLDELHRAVAEDGAGSDGRGGEEKGPLLPSEKMAGDRCRETGRG